MVAEARLEFANLVRDDERQRANALYTALLTDCDRALSVHAAILNNRDHLAVSPGPMRRSCRLHPRGRRCHGPRRAASLRSAQPRPEYWLTSDIRA